MLRVLRWLALGVAGLVIAAVIALGFYSRSDHFLKWLEGYAMAALNASSRGQISWARVDGSIWSRIGIDHLQVHHHGRAIFTAQRAELEIALLPLLWRRVQISRLTAIRPMLDMRRQDDGDWNIVQALTSGEPSSGPSQWTIAIDAVALRNGELALRLAAGGNDIYRLRQLEVAGRVQIAAGLAIFVDRLASWVETPQTPPLYASGGLSYRQTEPAQRFAFEKLWLQTAQSRVMLAGAITDFSRWEGDLRLHIDRLAAADIARYAAQWPAGIDVAGAATMRGPAGALAGEFDLQLAGARVSGSVGADLLAARKTYRGVLAIQKLSLERFLAHKEIAGGLNAEVKISGAGFGLETLSGSGVAQLQGLAFQGRDLGAASLQANWHGGAVKFSAEVSGPLGSGAGRGELRWAETPTYQGELSLRDLNAGALLQLKDAARLSIAARVSGAGFDPATAHSRAEVDLLASQWDQVSVQSGKLVARITAGRLHIDELRAQALGANLTAQGVLGIAAPQTGQVSYQLHASDLTPWLRLLDRQGSGQLRLHGRAQGSLARLQTNGVMELRQVKLAEGSVAGARIDFALTRRRGATLPQGTLNFEASGLEAAAVAGARLRAAIALPAAPQRVIFVRAEGRDGAGRALRIVADIDDQPAQLVVRARELVATVGGTAWTMTAPATIARRGDDFFIDRLELRSGSAQLLAGGRVSLAGAQSFDLRVTGLEPALLRDLWPQQVQVSGTLSAQAQVRGSAAAPEITAAAELGAGQIAGQNYQAIRGRADYRQRSVALDLIVAQDSTHDLQVRGVIPLALAWAPAWRAELVPGMELRARSAGLSVAFLNALKLPLQKITGQVALDLLITGSFSEPQTRGSFELLDSAFSVPDLGIRVTGVGISGSADQSRLRLTRVAARAAGGTLSGSGALALKRWTPQEIAVDLTARRWPAIATERYQASVDADIKIGGALTAPTINGKVRLIEGTVRPALNLLERSPVDLQRDPTIVVVQRRGGPPIAPKTNGKDQNANDTGNGLWRSLILDVSAAIPNNLWVRHPNASVELAGNLRINKRAEQELTLTGAIETVRGWVGFQGRRFEISRGRVQFTGAQPIDPRLEIVAEYRVDDYRVSAIAGGTASKPTLELASQPQLEQSDILSLLLFGRPIAELSGTEQLSLQKSAIDIGAGFAAAQLGKAVSGALGLDALGIDLSDVTFSGGQVRFGRYLGSQTYFSVSQDIAGRNGREVSLEYRLTPNLRVEANTNSNGNSGVDIIWRKRY